MNQKVLMLVNNTFENDARVDRSAKTLVQAGYTVLLLAKHRVGLPLKEEMNGYTVLRSQWDGTVHGDPLRRWERDFSHSHPLKKKLFGGEKGINKLSKLAGSEEIFHLSQLTRLDQSIFTSYSNLYSYAPKWLALLATLFFPVVALLRLRLPRWLNPKLSAKESSLPALFRVEDDNPFWKRRTQYYRFSEKALDVAKDFNPDIVHAHDFNTLLAAVDINEKYKVPYVYDTHELWVHRNRANVPYSKGEIAWEEEAEKVAMHGATFSITVCDSIADHLAKEYDLPKPVVIRNTPEQDTNRRTTERSLRHVLGLEKSTRLTIYVGRITFNRGVEDIVRALPYINEDVQFVTLGYFDKRFEPEYQELVDSLGVRDRVHAYGPVPISEVADWVADADVSFTTMRRSCLSYIYTLPNKLFESLQAEVPIIGPDSPEICRIVETYSCGTTYRDDDPQHLAEQVNKLFASPESYKQYKEGAIAASKELCWDLEKEKLLSAYEKHFSKKLAA